MLFKRYHFKNDAFFTII